MIESCSDCRFFHRDAHGSGTCRRYGPALPIESYGRWPRVGPEEWCGDFTWIPEREPCAQCKEPCGLGALRYGNGEHVVCKTCDDARPRFEPDLGKIV